MPHGDPLLSLLGREATPAVVQVCRPVPLRGTGIARSPAETVPYRQRRHTEGLVRGVAPTTSLLVP